MVKVDNVLMILTSFLLICMITPRIHGDTESETSALPYYSGDTVSFFCPEHVFNAGSKGSDCWGWVDANGNEYAIYAGSNSIRFYNLTTKLLAAIISAPTSTWRDIKTYQNYCYAVSEDEGTYEGLMVMDMSFLPDSIHYIRSVNTAPDGDVTSHNLSIDTIKGYAYLEGSHLIGQSVRVFDLSDPTFPAYVTSFGAGGLHDMYCMNDTLYLAEGGRSRFSIWDMSNKFSPVELASVIIPNAGYVHNIWPSADRKYAVTTEETVDKTVKIWDIQDLNNIQLLGEYLAPNDMAHNAHFQGDTVFISHYESGVVVLDISDPYNPTELYTFDTYDDAGQAQYDGCWGIYPHTPSGRFYGSNTNGKFYIFEKFNQVLTDSIVASDVQIISGEQVKVDVWAKFDFDIQEFEIPFQWSGPSNLIFDSVSTVGLMTEYFELQQMTSYDAFNKRAAFKMIASSNNMSAPELPAGSGVIMSLFFTSSGSEDGGDNMITFPTFNGKEAKFVHNCITYGPQTVPGTVLVQQCCVGIRGNADGDPNDLIDVSDLVSMVDYAFNEGPEPVCTKEADIDASGVIDIGDIVALAAYMFNSGPEPQPCM